MLFHRTRKKDLYTRKNVRLDMTALLDVALLCVCFFVLYDFAKRSAVMDLIMPPPSHGCCFGGCGGEWNEKKLLNLTLLEKDSVQYDIGFSDPVSGKIPATRTAIAHIINHHLRKAAPLSDNEHYVVCWDPIFIIHPTSNSRYENLIVVLDELNRAGARKYTLADE